MARDFASSGSQSWPETIFRFQKLAVMFCMVDPQGEHSSVSHAGRTKKFLSVGKKSKKKKKNKIIKTLC